jgi:peptide/nickel transport system ATP-binding protein
MAYSMGPELIIADEATTALDVTIQAQVLDIMKELQSEKDLSVLLITHDLGIIAENCQKVAIMYAGRVVEFGPVNKVLLEPKHPYTKGLIKALPRTDKEVVPEGIPGTVPDLVNPPTGCPFNLRCPYATEVCKTRLPPYCTEDDVSTACNLYVR